MSRIRYKTTKGTIVFRVIFFVLLAAAIITVAAILSWLWRFLESYEISQTYRVADAVVAELERGEYEKLFTGEEINMSPYETTDAYKAAAKAKITGELTYAKSARESRSERPVYVLKANGEGVAYLALELSETKTEFGFDMYKFGSIYGLEVPMNEQVTVTVPSNYTVYINGIALDDSAITASEPIEEAANFGDFLDSSVNTQAINTYTVTGLINKPTVTVTDGDGSEKTPLFDEARKQYVCELENSESDTAKSAEEYAVEFAHVYSKYIANDVYLSSISPYLIEGTKLCTDINEYEGQFYTWHSSYEFSGDETVSVHQYSDNCVAVRVKYVHTVYSGGEGHDFPADNTVFAVKTDDGWKTAALVMN